MIDNLLADPLAAFFGVVGMVCLMAWPLFRSRTGMLAAQLGIAVGLGLHYWLLDVRTAAVMQALSFAQIVAAIPLERRPGLRVLYLALVPVIAAAAALTWQGPASFFSSAALSLITLARMQRDPRRLRILMLAAGPFWMAHDWMVGSLPAFSADVVSFSVGLWKLRAEGRPRPGGAPADRSRGD